MLRSDTPSRRSALGALEYVREVVACLIAERIDFVVVHAIQRSVHDSDDATGCAVADLGAISNPRWRRRQQNGRSLGPHARSLQGLWARRWRRTFALSRKFQRASCGT